MSGKAEIDGELRLLADESRRVVLTYLREHSDNRATVAELSTRLSRGTSLPEERDQQNVDFETKLHHMHLPELEAHGLVQYDGENGTVRYQSNERIERLLGHIANIEATTESVRENDD